MHGNLPGAGRRTKARKPAGGGLSAPAAPSAGWMDWRAKSFATILTHCVLRIRIKRLPKSRQNRTVAQCGCDMTRAIAPPLLPAPASQVGAETWLASYGLRPYGTWRVPRRDFVACFSVSSRHAFQRIASSPFRSRRFSNLSEGPLGACRRSPTGGRSIGSYSAQPRARPG